MSFAHQDAKMSKTFRLGHIVICIISLYSYVLGYHNHLLLFFMDIEVTRISFGIRYIYNILQFIIH